MIGLLFDSPLRDHGIHVLVMNFNRQGVHELDSETDTQRDAGRNTSRQESVVPAPAATEPPPVVSEREARDEEKIYRIQRDGRRSGELRSGELPIRARELGAIIDPDQLQTGVAHPREAEFRTAVLLPE